MANSIEGNSLAYGMILYSLMFGFEQLLPGSVQPMLDSLAITLSNEAEKGHETAKDALMLIGEMSEKLQRELPDRPEKQASSPVIERPHIDLQPWLHDKDAMPATLEGQAVARLTFNMLTFLLFKLDELDPHQGLVPYVLNSTSSDLSHSIAKNGPTPMYDEMHRILHGTFEASKIEWERNKPK